MNEAEVPEEPEERWWYRAKRSGGGGGGGWFFSAARPTVPCDELTLTSGKFLH